MRIRLCLLLYIQKHLAFSCQPACGLHSFVGSAAMKHRGLLKLQYPMEHGVVRDWADMERVWAHVFWKDNLNVAPSEHPVHARERICVRRV